MTAFDRVDWHLADAMRHDQPQENAGTHIGLYLDWLVRHDLHNTDVFTQDRVAELSSGQISGSDLLSDVDGKLASFALNEDGQAFTEACYSSYLERYGETFAHLPDYAVPNDSASRERIAPVVDALYADWVANGRPAPVVLPVGDDHAAEKGAWAAGASGSDFDVLLDLSPDEARNRLAEVMADVLDDPGNSPL